MSVEFVDSTYKYKDINETNINSKLKDIVFNNPFDNRAIKIVNTEKAALIRIIDDYDYHDIKAITNIGEYYGRFYLNEKGNLHISNLVKIGNFSYTVTSTHCCITPDYSNFILIFKIPGENVYEMYSYTDEVNNGDW